MALEKCEVCNSEEHEYLCGCEGCGRMFGPCCNSMADDECVDCFVAQAEDVVERAKCSPCNAEEAD